MVVLRVLSIVVEGEEEMSRLVETVAREARWLVQVVSPPFASVKCWKSV